MISERQLRETIQTKFREVWKQKSFLGKNGKELGSKDKVPTRKFGIRKQVSKMVTDEQINEFVEAFIKKENEKGFSERFNGEFYIRTYPTVQVMIETYDDRGRARLLDNPVVAIYADAGFIPAQRKK